MDKFGVSDEFVHEISMEFDDIPRLYLVKQCRNDLNKICHITPTPGRALGAQHSFRTAMTEKIEALASEFDYCYYYIKMKMLINDCDSLFRELQGH